MAARRRSGSATRPTSRCVFTQPTEKISQFTVDVLRYIAGELKTSDITEGTYVDSWAEAAKKVSTTQQILPQMPKAELDKRTAAVFGKTPVELRPGRPMSAQVRGALLAATEKVSALQSSSTIASNNQATVLARMGMAAGTSFEAQLTTGPMMQAAGVTSPAADLGRSASILAGMNPTFMRQARQARARGMAASGQLHPRRACRRGTTLRTRAGGNSSGEVRQIQPARFAHDAACACRAYARLRSPPHARGRHHPRDGSLLRAPSQLRELVQMNQINVWELGTDSDPTFENRIEFHDPNGSVYVAKTSGTETLFGKTKQKGIGARVLEWANTLLERAYQTKAVTKNGVTWYPPVLDASGAPMVKDPSNEHTTVKSCAANPACVQLLQYVSVPKFIREGMKAYGLDAQLKRVY